MLPYNGSDAWVEPAPRDVADCLASDRAPEAAPGLRLLRVRGAGGGDRLRAKAPRSALRQRAPQRKSPALSPQGFCQSVSLTGCHRPSAAGRRREELRSIAVASKNKKPRCLSGAVCQALPITTCARAIRSFQS